MDFDDVWLLPSKENDHFNLADWLREAEAAHKRQAAADRFFKALRTGEVEAGDAEAFFDQLAEDGVDPNAYVDQIIDNVELVMADGRPINTDGLGQHRHLVTTS